MNKVLIVTVLLLAVFTFGAFARRGPRIPREVRMALQVNATEIQDHADMFFLFASIWLNEPENQANISDALRRAKNIANLIDVSSVREAVVGTVDDVFNVLENLRSNLNNTLIKISNLNSERRGDFGKNLREAFEDLKNSTVNELLELKNRTEERLAPVVFVHVLGFSFADNQTVEDVQYLVNQAISLFSSQTSRFLNKLGVGARALDAIGGLLDGGRRSNLESTIKRAAREFAQDLNDVNISYFRSLSRNGLTFLFDKVENLRSELISVADQALVAASNNSSSNDSSLNSSSPGAVVSERLLALREGFGERVVAFRENAIDGLKRLLRDSLEALNIRNLPDVNSNEFKSAVKNTYRNIKQRVEEVVNAVNRLYRL